MQAAPAEAPRETKVIEIKSGPNVTVKIYPVRNKKTGYESFHVADYSSGKRKLVSLSDEGEARRKAQDIADKIAGAEKAVLLLRDGDKHVYVRSVDILKPTGMALDVAASRCADAVKILGGDYILDAAHAYAARNPRNMVKKTVPEVYDLMIDHVTAMKKSDRYVEDIRLRCKKFADMFQVPIANVTAEGVQTFLDTLMAPKGKGTKPARSPRTYNNYLSAIKTMFRFAQKKKLLPRDYDELAGLEPMNDSEGDIEIYTPEEIARLLAVAPKDIAPVIAIGAFAGLRSAEIERLDWSEISFEEGHIEIKARKSKTAARRIVPLLDNLAAWLKPHLKKSGPVWTTSHAYYHERLRETAAATKTDTAKAIKWKANALRHSFISYRVAQTQNVAQVALEAGNSAKQIFQHYRELVTLKQATAWFSVGLANAKAKGGPNLISQRQPNADQTLIRRV